MPSSSSYIMCALSTTIVRPSGNTPASWRQHSWSQGVFPKQNPALLENRHKLVYVAKADNRSVS